MQPWFRVQVWTDGSDIQRKDLAVFCNGKDTAAVLGIGIQELPGKAKILPLVHGDHAADPGQIQEVPGTPEAVLSQPGVQGQHGQIQMPVLERLRIGFEVDFHVPVPAGIFALPVPPVQIPGVKQSAAAHGDEEGHTLIGGGQRLNLYAGRKFPDFPAAQTNAVLRSGVGNIPAGAVAVSQPDVPAQQECDVPGAAEVIAYGTAVRVL